MRWRGSDAPFLLVLVAILGLGFFTYNIIPRYEPFLGLDFHNLFQFHHCSAADVLGPYLASGADCLDVSGRSMVYPPLLFRLFGWVGFVGSFEVARNIWMTLMAITMVGVGFVWAADGARTPRDRLVLGLIWLMLLAQFPLVFAFERGNNDVLVVGLWTLVSLAAVRERYVAAGVFATLATAAKIYPIVAAAMLLVGLTKAGGRRTTAFLAGGVATALVVLLLDLGSTGDYLEVALPNVSSIASPLSSFSHSITSLPYPTLARTLLGVGLAGAWVWAAVRRYREDPLLILAGGLAISTYFPALSYDYNLVTVYPLTLVVIARAIRDDGRCRWRAASVAVVLFTMAGRELFTPTAQVTLQALTLIAIGLAAGMEPSRTTDATAREPAAPTAAG